jgi:site-specific DNA recombinase
LVGHLFCPQCNRAMTGSGSRGNGSVYHYYHCQRKYGCKNTLKAGTANNQFKIYLGSFQPDKNYVKLYEEILKDEFKSSGVDRESQKYKLRRDIQEVEERLKKAVIKNLDNVLSDSLFEKTCKALEWEKDQLMLRLDNLNKIVPEFNTYLTNSTSLISNIDYYYSECDTEIKKKLIGSIFPEKIYFENGSYRTTNINEAFALMCNIDKGFQKEKPDNCAGLSSVAPPAGLEPATL